MFLLKTLTPPHSHPMLSCPLLPRCIHFCQFQCVPPVFPYAYTEIYVLVSSSHLFTQSAVFTIHTICSLLLHLATHSGALPRSSLTFSPFHSCIIIPLCNYTTIYLSALQSRYGLVVFSLAISILCCYRNSFCSHVQDCLQLKVYV